MKSELINKLESYIYDYQYFLEKSKDVDNIKKEIDTLMSRRNDMKLKNMCTDELDRRMDFLIENQTKEEKNMSKLIIQKEEIEIRVEDMPQPYKNILFLKYIKGNSFDEIAKKMHYSTKRIYQLHKEGVEIYVQLVEQLNVPEISKS